ncbi:MAG: hypothetical protein UT01_C0022G0001, partial [Candidatus Daviesbacteria bacterium GW2011_GWA1_38_7]
ILNPEDEVVARLSPVVVEVIEEPAPAEGEEAVEDVEAPEGKEVEGEKAEGEEKEDSETC